MARVKFVTGMPIAVVTTKSGKKIISIADVHLGVEIELKAKGFNVPLRTKHLANKLIDVMLRFQPDILLILGDLKHQIKGLNKEVLREVKLFTNLLRKSMSHVKIIVVRGNHDGALRSFDDVKVYPSSGILIDDVGFIHGNAKPNPSTLTGEVLLMGHVHPALPSKLGGQRIWVIYHLSRKMRGRLAKRFKVEVNVKRVIIQPAYNDYLGGVFEADSLRRLCPLFRGLLDPLKGYVYGLDGTFIGRFSSLSSGSS